jgi:hypothetical protein
MVFARASIVMPLLWMLGAATSHTMGDFIYFLPIIAILAGLIRVFRDDDTWA